MTLLQPVPAVELDQVLEEVARESESDPIYQHLNGAASDIAEVRHLLDEETIGISELTQDELCEKVTNLLLSLIDNAKAAYEIWR